MTIDEIRKFRNAEPFHPFHVKLSNGKTLLVRQPENIGFSDASPFVSVFESDDAGDIVDLKTIVEVAPAKPTAARKNGRRGGRN